LKLNGIEGRKRMESKEAFKAKMDAQLKEWSTKIAQLKSKAEVAETMIKDECLRQVDTLRVKSEEANEKLEELKKSGDEAWDTMKAGVEKASSELKDAINSVVSKFK
jgi:chromosome segregation ATPase